MRLRTLVPVVLLALGALLAPACGGGDDDSASATSDEREQGGETGNPDSGSEDSGDSGAGSTDPDDFDLGDLPDEIPGFEEFGDCFDLATDYGALYFDALAGEDSARQAQQKAEEMKDKLPDDLHDDIDVVADAIGKVAEEGLLSGSDALDSDEYNAANDAINQYFEQECGG